ncbi:MAG: hypothetical protein JSW11_15670 [Candidatus Heimdallarchaeota archaeon]|nr:MAG: hypothetical protein JSW11_15670 [Candidatus Heimdallarchaeota archaeon]
MIGVSITTKEGILLFSYYFVPGFSNVDEDLRAGLMTAVLNAVQKTQNGTGIRTIDQGKYFVHIVDGEFTHGIFFSHENDLKEQNFANNTLKHFEKTFHHKLVKGLSFDNSEFTGFRNYLKQKYNALIAIDVVGLSKIIEIMEESFFTDYIILEKPNLHQVFTHAKHNFVNHLASTCKSLLESSLKIGYETTKIEFNLGDEYLIFVTSLTKYVVILIVQTKDRNKVVKEIARIYNSIESFFTRYLKQQVNFNNVSVSC